MLTFGDLPRHPEHGIHLSCDCGEYSAHRGDYFTAPDDREIPDCSRCESPLKLVRKRTVIEVIKE